MRPHFQRSLLIQIPFFLHNFMRYLGQFIALANIEHYSNEVLNDLFRFNMTRLKISKNFQT